MVHEPFSLAGARVLISNDDGIRAPGLEVLEQTMRRLAAEVWVVAPDTEQSAASHSLTIRRPLYVREVAERRFSVDGTPTDCVLLAVHKVMRDCPPDLVLSGINRGGNMGEDAAYSGTVAAAMEGTLLGFRSVALSLFYDDRAAVKWETAACWTGHVLARLAAARWPKDTLINVNFPDVAAGAVSGIEVTRQGRRKIGGAIVEGFDPRGERYYWIGAGREEVRGQAGTDLEAVCRGAVSVTPLHRNLTHAAALDALRAAFA
ncbi:MAG: 5'/3'-nucleotidase SurE [Rhodospirillales bacterium]|nr:MAG: 5'/3'-nucleotidase SurE [Rhodospirillales bacterium]